MKTVEAIHEESGHCGETEHFKSSVFIARNAAHGKTTMSLQIPKEQKDGQDVFLYRCDIDGEIIDDSLFSLDGLICLYHLVEAQLRLSGIETTQLVLVESDPEEPST